MDTTTTPPQPEPKVTTRAKSYREFLQKVAYPDWHQGEGEPSQVFLQTVANPAPNNNHHHHQPDPTWHPHPTPQPTREGPAGGRAQAGPAGRGEYQRSSPGCCTSMRGRPTPWRPRD